MHNITKKGGGEIKMKGKINVINNNERRGNKNERREEKKVKKVN